MNHLEKKIIELDETITGMKKNIELMKNNQDELIKKEVIQSSLNALKGIEDEVVDHMDSETLEEFLTQVIALHIPFKGQLVEEIISKSVVIPVINVAKYGLKSIDDILFYNQTKMTKNDYMKKLQEIKENSLKFSGNLIKNMNRPTDKNEIIVELYKQCFKKYDSADECKRLTSDFGITRYDLDTIKSLVIYISMNPDSINFQGDRMTSEHLKSLGILQ